MKTAFKKTLHLELLVNIEYLPLKFVLSDVKHQELLPEPTRKKIYFECH